MLHRLLAAHVVRRDYRAASDENMPLALEEDGRPRLTCLAPLAPGLSRRRCRSVDCVLESAFECGAVWKGRRREVRRCWEAAFGVAREAAVHDQVRVWPRCWCFQACQHASREARCGRGRTLDPHARRHSRDEHGSATLANRSLDARVPI